jgi:hypothetical protein
MKFQRAQPRVEVEVLVCCARTHTDAKTLDRLGVLLEQELDWDFLIRTALTHGVLPLLYSNLHQCRHVAVPRPIWDQLHNHFRANIQHSFFLTAELLKLLKLFDKHGIPGIPFKGPVLAASAYQDVTLRQFADLDILVHKKNIQEAGRLILSQGYRSESFVGDDFERVIDIDDVAFFGPQYYTFYRPDGRSRVDLQWRLTDRYFSFSLDKEGLWQHLAPVSLSGRTVYSFTPTHILLILCVHGSKHHWEKLKWVCDVAELIRAESDNIDWDKLWRQASVQGAERMLGLGLSLAAELLGAPLPATVAKHISSDKTLSSMVRQIIENLFAPPTEAQSDLNRIIFYLRAKDRWHNRTRFIVRYISQCFKAVVIPGLNERELVSLPSFLSFVYFFIRPLRLVAKYGGLVLSRVFKKASIPTNV